MSKELREFIPDLLQSINEIMPKWRTYRRDGSPVWLNDKERSQLDGVQIRVNKVMPTWYGLNIYVADGVGQSTSADVIPGNEFIGAYKTAVSALGSEVSPLMGRTDLSDPQSGLISLYRGVYIAQDTPANTSGLILFLTDKVSQLKDQISTAPSVLRKHFLEDQIKDYERSRAILSKSIQDNAEDQPSTYPLADQFFRKAIWGMSQKDWPSLQNLPEPTDEELKDSAKYFDEVIHSPGGSILHPEYPGMEDLYTRGRSRFFGTYRLREIFSGIGDDLRILKEKTGRFPLRPLLAALGLVALALLLKDSPFIRQPDTNPAGQITITQLYPPINPGVVVGEPISTGSDALPKPQEIPSPFTTFINSRVVVKPGDNVWTLVKEAQIAAFGEGWVNSENGVERADAVAGIVVELMIKDGFNPHLLILGQEFSISNHIKPGAGMDVMEAAVNTGSVGQYQEVVAPAVRQYFLP